MRSQGFNLPSRYPISPLTQEKEKSLRELSDFEAEWEKNKPVLEEVKRQTERPPARAEPIDTMRDKLVARLEILRSMRDTCYFCLTESIDSEDIILYSTQVNFLLKRGAIKDRNKGTGRPPRYVLTGHVPVEPLEDECRKKLAVNTDWRALPKIAKGKKTAAHRGRIIISLDILKIIIKTGEMCLDNIPKKDRAAYMRQARRLGMDGAIRILNTTLVQGSRTFVPVSSQALREVQEDLQKAMRNEA